MNPQPFIPVKLATTAHTWASLPVQAQVAEKLKPLQKWAQPVQTKLAAGSTAEAPTNCLVLFNGPDSEGKQFAAALLAREANREIYRVDLSAITSEFIGETEKNLARLFEQAESKNWILFFDEADALFGKRTNVRDAHDKYANQEIAYLLQRMEEYKGLVILASNAKGNLDNAFMRRLRFIIQFPRQSSTKTMKP